MMNNIGLLKTFSKVEVLQICTYISTYSLILLYLQSADKISKSCHIFLNKVTMVGSQLKFEKYLPIKSLTDISTLIVYIIVFFWVKKILSTMSDLLPPVQEGEENLQVAEGHEKFQRVQEQIFFSRVNRRKQVTPSRWNFLHSKKKQSY